MVHVISPLSSRMNVLKDDIARLEGEFAHMATVEDYLVMQLETLRLSMQKHQSRINQLRSDCAPIASIPNEILVAIFEAGISAYEDREEYAMCISHVSRLWRNIALATPSLWTSIHVNCECIGDGQLRMLELFTARSHRKPLDITMDLVRDDDADSWDELLLCEQTDIVFPLVSRWRSLRVSGTFREEVFNVLSPLRHLYAPILEAFEVKVESSAVEPDEFDEPLLLFQRGAPRLTHVEIHEISLTACEPPLSSLTSLHLHHPPNTYDIDRYRHMLVASNHLTELQLVGDIVDTGQLYMIATSPTSSIKIPTLRSLTISPSWSAGSFTIYSLLASLETPALESLTMRCCPWKNHVSEFQEVFRNYGPPRFPLLRSLTLQFADFDQPGALWFPSVLPSITHISLIGCKSSARFLGLLLSCDAADEGLLCTAPIKDYSDSVALPLLTDICLAPMEMPDLVVICSIVSERILRRTPITCVRFHIRDLSNIPQDRLEWLRERIQVKACESN